MTVLGPEELTKNIEETPSLMTGKSPAKEWIDTPAEFRPGNWCYSAKAPAVEALKAPNPRTWSPDDEDWKLPEDWFDIISKGFKERLDKYRSLKIFMDVCVRCGACADKCHFFLGTGDPKNMPVLRAELMRSCRMRMGRVPIFRLARVSRKPARSRLGVKWGIASAK